MENTSRYLEKERAEVEKSIEQAKEIMKKELGVEMNRDKEMVEKEIREVEEDEEEEQYEESKQL